jgi:hypothetical protein
MNAQTNGLRNLFFIGNALQVNFVENLVIITLMPVRKKQPWPLHGFNKFNYIATTYKYKASQVEMQFLEKENVM